MAEGSWNLKISPFNVVAEDHIATGEKWNEWLEEIEREMRCFRIKEPVDKKDAMLIFGGTEIRRLEKSLENPSDGDEYTKLKDKLTNYFAPKKNVHYSTYLFLKMRPMEGESTVAYAARLREQAMNCDFHYMDKRILEQIIQTTDNSELVRRVLHKKWTLQETLAEMQIQEDTCMQVKAMGQRDTQDIARISRKKPNEGKKKHEAASNIHCKYCDRTHPKNKDLCPAYGKTCAVCGKRNHFAIVCFSKQGKDNNKVDRRGIRRTIDDSDTDDLSDEDLDFLDDTVKQLKIRKVDIHKVSDYVKTSPIVVNDVTVHIFSFKMEKCNVINFILALPIFIALHDVILPTSLGYDVIFVLSLIYMAD